MKKTIRQEYRIRIKRTDLPCGRIKIAFLTDVHNCCGPEEMKWIFSALKQAEPDLVLCGGDILTAKPGLTPDAAAFFMNRLGSRYPVYAGTGNHEYRAKLYPEQYGSLYRRYRTETAESGVCFLENESAETTVDRLPVRITGFDLPKQYYQRLTRRELTAGTIEKAVGRPAAGRLNLLLAHNPEYLGAYFQWGADVAFCGHCHGGLIRFGEHTGAVGPNFRPFPHYVHGLYRQKQKSVVVSAGMGEHSVPIRIFNPRELVTVDLAVNKE